MYKKNVMEMILKAWLHLASLNLKPYHLKQISLQFSSLCSISRVIKNM